jgi:hypothetical protein
MYVLYIFNSFFNNLDFFIFSIIAYKCQEHQKL